MEAAKMVVLAVVIAIVVAAAIFTGLDVFLSLKTARGSKSEYFNIGYKSEYGTKFCRAHLVGKVGKVGKHGNKMLYVVEIHPKDAAKVYAWTVPKTELRGVYLLEKGKFYKLAFEEELYERTKASL